MRLSQINTRHIDMTFTTWENARFYFCAINVTDASAAEVNEMIVSAFSGTNIQQRWKRKIDFATVNNNPVIDGWRIRVFTTNPGFSNRAGITRDMVENYLTKWNAQVFSAAMNEVVFDVAIFKDSGNNPGALQSMEFWGVAPIAVFFNETAYNSGTGIHTIEVNYGASIYTSKQVQNRIEQRDGIVLSNTAGVVTFTISRTAVFKWFQQEVKSRLDKGIYRRQFRIPETIVDTIIATGTQHIIDHYWDEARTQFKGTVEYRVLDVTLAQVQAFIINRLDEDL